jgi:hypothetical protein
MEGQMTDATSQTTTGVEPRDAAWVRALPFVVGGLLLFVLLKFIGVVPGSGGMPGGTYQCMTATNIAPYGNQVPRSREDLRRETGQDQVGDIMVPGAMVIPAPFGNIEIDEGGSYRMISNGAEGSYAMDTGAGTLSFTGEMAVLTVSGFDAEAGRFLAAYEDMRFDCNLLRQ